MLELGLLILCLLCAGALWLALGRLRAADERRAEAERESARLHAELEKVRTGEEKRRAAVDESGVDGGAAGPARLNEEAVPALRLVSDSGEAASAEWTQTGGTAWGAETAREVEATEWAEATEKAEAAGDAPQALAWGLDEFFNRTAHPRELLESEEFNRGVELLRDGGATTVEMIAHTFTTPAVLACMALEALARRTPDSSGETAERLLPLVNDCWPWQRFYALRALGAHARRPVLAGLLASLDSSWREFVPLSSLREFVAGRLEAGEALTLDDLLAACERGRLGTAQVAEVGLLMGDLSDVLPAGLAEGLAVWVKQRETMEFLKSFGRVWEAGAGGEVFTTPTVEARVSEIESALRNDPPRSVLLVGDSGTGKTAVLRAAADRLRADGWLVFEAGAADLISGQQYIGMIEGRLHSLVREVGDRRVLWVVPNFHEMLWAGRHSQNPTGVLDMMLPEIESGKLKVVGEIEPAPFEQLVRMRPKLRTAMQTCLLSPLGDEETMALGRRWSERFALGLPLPGADMRRVPDETLREAFQLAQQYLADKAAPGNLLFFLDAARRRQLAEDEASYTQRQLTLDDLLVTLSQMTGLPRQILDEREGLDLSALRAFFERRVLGQPEAVECLVERVAMVKAGVTDPTRPQGVFLFVGPTGTGKTEIAKTLAEFLFGSPDRMIRLDMSEFQTPDSLDRILGEASETSSSTALVNQIRKQPFSVVLLDEFEKAHPQVWDLFLQVFDDGRLTDRRGNTADFRHSVIIMTSNLGATLPHGASIGFSQEQAQFASASVERAVGRAFRREFVNRIDRVVVFRPLGRAVMRDLLRKELHDVLNRRGLRTRQWAVEWDESAIEFLLEKGFTADLGARPLKRAVERYLLAPLAIAIVNHQYPEGDQFLFVRSSAGQESLDVEFVDPDAPDPETAAESASAHAESAGQEAARAAAPEELRVEGIALDARGTAAELELLRDIYEELAVLVESGDWRGRKEESLRQTQSAHFWNSAARFSVLGLIEYMDRIEAGLDTAGSLLSRLGRAGSHEGPRRLPQDLVARLAQQLYLLGEARRGLEAGEPRDAFLLVAASDEPGDDRAAGSRFARALAGMYRRWAEKRRMRLAVLEERGGEPEQGDGAGGGYRALLAVSGYAAYTILKAEGGLHVLESPQGEKSSFSRARARVRVVGQPDEPAGHGPEALRRQAEAAMATDEATAQIVRRYREEPSPLVRDSVRGWRTGRLDRVLDGDFDLIT
ncbi:MAG TPA: AAA family ATPase [Pyrinomonadaceae bacterium]|nr:AAA family ATPase [Pyrinomonadaceae bacterium]